MQSQLRVAPSRGASLRRTRDKNENGGFRLRFFNLDCCLACKLRRFAGVRARSRNPERSRRGVEGPRGNEEIAAGPVSRILSAALSPRGFWSPQLPKEGNYGPPEDRRQRAAGRQY